MSSNNKSYDCTNNPRILSIRKAEKIYFWSIKFNKLMVQTKEIGANVKCQLCIPKYAAFSKSKPCEQIFNQFSKLKRHYVSMENRFARTLVWIKRSEVPDNLSRKRELGDLSTLEQAKLLRLAFDSTILVDSKYKLLEYLQDDCPCKSFLSDGSNKLCATKLPDFRAMFTHLACIEKTKKKYVLFKANTYGKEHEEESKAELETESNDELEVESNDDSNQDSDEELDYSLDDKKTDLTYNFKSRNSSIDTKNDRISRSENRRKFNNGRRVYKSTGGLNMSNGTDDKESKINNSRNEILSSISSTQHHIEKPKFSYVDSSDGSDDELFKNCSKKIKVEDKVIKEESSKELIVNGISNLKSKIEINYSDGKVIYSTESPSSNSSSLNQNSEIKNSRNKCPFGKDDLSANSSSNMFSMEISESEDEEVLLNRLYLKMKCGASNEKLSDQKIDNKKSVGVVEEDEEVIVLD